MDHLTFLLYYLPFILPELQYSSSSIFCCSFADVFVLSSFHFISSFIHFQGVWSTSNLFLIHFLLCYRLSSFFLISGHMSLIGLIQQCYVKDFLLMGFTSCKCILTCLFFHTFPSQSLLHPNFDFIFSCGFILGIFYFV